MFCHVAGTKQSDFQMIFNISMYLILFFLLGGHRDHKKVKKPK